MGFSEFDKQWRSIDFKNKADELCEKYGWQKITPVNSTTLQPGDILVVYVEGGNHHVEIYAGDGRSYSAGGNNSIHADTISTSFGKFQFALRVSGGVVIPDSGYNTVIEGEYEICTVKSLDSILSKYGRQVPNECLDWACKYVKDMIGASSYRIIGSEDKKILLRVAAAELRSGRPVIAHVIGKGRTYDPDGEIRGSRHFITIVRT